MAIYKKEIAEFEIGNDIPKIFIPFESLREIPQFILFRSSWCVYFLLFENEIIYVGSTNELQVRIYAHFSLRKEFDRVLFIPIKDTPAYLFNFKDIQLWTRRVEHAFIRYFRPKLNQNGKIHKCRTEDYIIVNLFRKNEHKQALLPKISLFQHISKLGLQEQTYGLLLLRSRIRKIGDLVQQTEESLLQIGNFGLKKLEDVKDCLDKVGLTLAITSEVFEDLISKELINEKS